MSEEGYKLVQDLTQIANQEVKYFHDFPEAVKILSVGLYLRPDGWGGKEYVIIIRYEFDNVQYKIERAVYSGAKNTLIDMLFDILNHYERMHIIQ